MDTPSPARRRPVLAVVGGLAIAGVVGGLVLYQRHAQSRLARIVACRRCGMAGQPVEASWVVVQPGDSWAVAMDASTGVVIRGPARFQVMGFQRIALSTGIAFLTSGASGRMVVLLPRGESPGAEGATVATAGPGSQVAAFAQANGNGVSVEQGSAALQLRAGPRALKSGEQWLAQPTLTPPTPEAEEMAWLKQLAGRP